MAKMNSQPMKVSIPTELATHARNRAEAALPSGEPVSRERMVELLTQEYVAGYIDFLLVQHRVFQQNA